MQNGTVTDIQEKLPELSKSVNKIKSLDYESIIALGSLFNIEGRRPDSITAYFNNITLKDFLFNKRDQLQDLIETICEISFLKKIIHPINICSHNLLSSEFHYISADADGNYSFTLNVTPKYHNKLLILQLFPGGLFYLDDFKMLIDDQVVQDEDIYSFSLAQLKFPKGQYQISFLNPPRKLFFVHAMFYKPITKAKVKEEIYANLDIPNDTQPKTVVIKHLNHDFPFMDYLSQICKKHSNVCPECFQNVPFLRYEQVNAHDIILDYLADDNADAIIHFIEDTKITHIAPKYFTSILPIPIHNTPTILQAALFMRSVNCYNAILDYNLKRNEFHLINAKDKDGRCTIHFACISGDIALIERLLELGESLRALDNLNRTVFHYAIMFPDNKDLLYYLFDKEADFAFRTDIMGLTPFHLAPEYGNLKAIEVYEEKLLSSNFKDMKGFLNQFKKAMSPLHVSCQYDQLEIVKHFISQGTFIIQYKQNECLSPLELAVSHDDLDLLDLIVTQITSAQLSPTQQEACRILERISEDCCLQSFSFLAQLDFWKNVPISSYIFGYLLSCLGQQHLPDDSCFPLLFESPTPSCVDFLHRAKLSHHANLNTKTIDDMDISESDDVHEYDDDLGDNDFDICESNSDLANNNLNPVIRTTQTAKKCLKEKEDGNIISVQMENANEFRGFRGPRCLIQFPNEEEDVNDTSDNNIDVPDESAEVFVKYGTYSLFFAKNPIKNMPQKFETLINFTFDSKPKVKKSMNNISILEDRQIYTLRSDNAKIVYKCHYCQFNLVWRNKRIQDDQGIEIDHWYAVKNSFKIHTCAQHLSKPPSLIKEFIDEAIEMFNLRSPDRKDALTFLKTLFGNDVSSQRLMSRLMKANPHEIDDVYWWQLIPSYLAENIENGGYSDLYFYETNEEGRQKKEVASFAFLPHYAVSLLKPESKAILPVLIIDGTFQCSSVRGVFMIVMAVSSNRTNIPLGWAFGPKEDKATTRMILNLIRKVNPKIETIISDDSPSIKAAITEVFPFAKQLRCAWHISIHIFSKIIKSAFWRLIKADHPDKYRKIFDELNEEDEKHLREIMDNSGFTESARFFEGGINSQGDVTSSPCESVNSDIRKLKTDHPIKVSHYLELIGYNRCLDLLDLQGDLTPYCIKRLEKVKEDSQKFVVSLKTDENYGTSTVVYDRNEPTIQWEINTRSFTCLCGNCNDRSLPCAHLYKALGDRAELGIHPCYHIENIKKALRHINAPIQLSGLNIDPTFQCPDLHPEARRTTRHLFGHER